MIVRGATERKLEQENTHRDSCGVRVRAVPHYDRYVASADIERDRTKKVARPRDSGVPAIVESKRRTPAIARWVEHVLLQRRYDAGPLLAGYLGLAHSSTRHYARTIINKMAWFWRTPMTRAG